MRKPVILGFASLLLVASSTAVAQPVSAFFQAVTNLNPVAYWPLSETAQPPAADVEANLGSLGAVANAYYSSLQASKGFTPGAIASESDPAVSLVSGQAGGFLAVPMTDPRVALPQGPFSVEVWIYPTNYNGSGLVSQTGPSGSGGLNGAANSAGWSLTQDYIPSQNSGNLQGWCFHVFNGNGLGGAEVVAAPGFALNTWYHIVGVFDGVNATLYINGTNASSTGLSTPMTGSYARDTWDPLFIGAARGFNNNRFGGGIDEVAIYTNALTPSQIANHYTAGTSLTPATPYEVVVANDQPYMYWRMNAPAYTAPAVSSYPTAANYGSLGAGLISRYQPGTIPGVPGPAFPGFGGSSVACAINGINACIDAGYASQLDPTGNSTPFTVVGWFKGNPNDANGRFEGVVGHGDSSWRFAVNNGNSRWNYGGSGAGDLIIPPSTINVNDGNWHMFAGVYDSAAGKQTLWIDGAVSLSSANTQSIPGKSSLDVLLGGAPDNVAAGNGNSYNQRFYPGSLAHLAFFTNALSALQIQALYGAAATPPVIVQQPASGISTNSGGTTKTFSVVASGAANLVYQWYYTNAGTVTALSDDLTHISGSTANLLTITNLVNAESGAYFVVVANTYGSVTSTLSGLQVVEAPLITAQAPAGPLTLVANQNFTLSVTALGTASLGYQWYTNGVADVGGTSATYPLNNVQLAMSGNRYACVVTNSVGNATSALVALIVQAPPNNGYAQAVLALNPVGYWPMHETAPPVAGDVETNLGTLGALGTGYYGDWNVNNGNPGNLAVFHQLPGALAGDPDTAAGFARAGGGYLLIPRTSPLTTLTPPFTLEAWVKPYDNSFGVILGEGGGAGLNGGANFGGFSWNWAGSASTFSLTVYNGSGSGSSEPKTLPVYTPGQWYHLVTTFDGANVGYYINGSPVGLQNSSTATMNPDTWSPLIIGGGRWSSGIQRQFDGAIDEVAIYTNVLSDSDIAAHYAAAANSGPAYKNAVQANQPLLYYRMNSPAFVPPAATTWPVLGNYGTAAINGVYRPGAVPGGVPGPLSPVGVPVAGLGAQTALAVGGMSAFADAGFIPAFNPSGRTPMSVALWVKCNPADAARGWQTFAGHSDSGWRCNINGGTGKFNFDSGNGKDVASAAVYNDGQWHHVVGTYDGTTTSVYVDGVLSGTGTSTANISGSTLDVILGGDPGSIGSVGPGRQLAGNLCEVAFWNNVALDATQVTNLYNAAGLRPWFIQLPVSASVNQNSAFTNTVVAGGSTPLAFQWYQNGSRLSGQTSATLGYGSVQPANGGSYSVVVSNTYGAITSPIVSLTVNSAPVVAIQPTNLLLYVGGRATLSAFATGAQPLSYQWLVNGTAIPGATASSYTLTNAQVSANYSCRVTNFVGPVTSTPVPLSVQPAPANPYPQAVLAANPIAYWRLNEPYDPNNPAANGTVANDYWGGHQGVYTNTSLGQAGYNNQVTDAETAALFGGGYFADSYAGNIAGIDFAAPANTSVAFSVEAWVNGDFQNGDNGIVTKGYSGNEQFNLDTGGSNHAFRFFVRDGSNTVRAVSTSIWPDSTWHHLVGVCDEFHGKLVFYIDGAEVSRTIIPPGSGIIAATNLLAIGSRMGGPNTDFNLQFSGSVNDVAIYNYALSPSQVRSQYLAAGIAPKLVQDLPLSTNVNENGTIVVPVSVLGTGPLAYQWYDGSGQPLAGQTSSSFVSSNVPLSANGTGYYVVVTNALGSVQSSFVTLTVNSGAPVIVQDLHPRVEAVAGSTYTYAVQATGTEPFGYQWFNGSTPLAGQTGPSYSLAVTQGNFSVVITNIYGAVTSVVSAMTLVSPPTDAYAGTILSYGAVGYWPLNETNSPPADLETNLGSLGTAGDAYCVSSVNVVKGVPGALAGDPDTAMTFLGSSGSWLGVPRQAPGLTVSNAFSVECWVNPADQNFAAILSQATPIGAQTVGYTGDANVRGWALYENGAAPPYSFSFHVYNGTTGGGAEPKESALWSMGAWYHVVGVFDGAIVTLYVNGLSSVTSQSQPAPGYAPNFWQPVEIGASGINHYMFNGSIDEVAIYNYALSPSQVEAHYEAGTNAAVHNYRQLVLSHQPLTYYRMDSPTYTAPDTNSYPLAVNYGSLGPDANGIYQPGTRPGVAGPPTVSFGQRSTAVAINGLNSCVVVPYNSLLDPTGQTPFSVTTWFKGNPADGAGRWEDILGHSDRSWRLQMNNTVPYFNNGGYVNGAPDVSIGSSVVNANDGNWHFFAGTYDGYNVTEYIDSFASSVSTLANIAGTKLDILIGGAPDNVEFGNNSTFNERFFPGSIAQVAFFTNALTSFQVQQLYSLGAIQVPTLSMAASAGHITLTWNAGTLLSAPSVAGPYVPVAGATSPYTLPPTGAQQYFRVRFP